MGVEARRQGSQRVLCVREGKGRPEWGPSAVPHGASRRHSLDHHPGALRRVQKVLRHRMAIFQRFAVSGRHVHRPVPKLCPRGQVQRGEPGHLWPHRVCQRLCDEALQTALFNLHKKLAGLYRVFFAIFPSVIASSFLGIHCTSILFSGMLFI